MSEIHLELADWRRRVARMWQDWRDGCAVDPERATLRFRAEKDRLFGAHPQTPLRPEDRASFRGLEYWPYDPVWRMSVPLRLEAEIPAAAAPPPAGAVGAFGAPIGGIAGLALPNSGDEPISFRRIGRATLTGPLEGRTLSFFWIQGYGGGIFVPFRDSTSGHETYGAGRYLWDSIKSADHGSDMETSTIVLDFNMAYHPSCAYDPRWSCPLAPVENSLGDPVAAGERLLAAPH